MYLSEMDNFLLLKPHSFSFLSLFFQKSTYVARVMSKYRLYSDYSRHSIVTSIYTTTIINHTERIK